MLLANQIVGLFDHQYLWKESIDFLDFLQGDNCQGKLASESTAFVASCASLLLSNYRVL